MSRLIGGLMVSCQDSFASGGLPLATGNSRAVPDGERAAGYSCRDGKNQVLTRVGSVVIIALIGWASTSPAQPLPSRMERLEAAGNTAGARTLLEEAVRSRPEDLKALTLYAGFLDRHHDAAAREVYRSLAGKLAATRNGKERASVLRRLVLLDLLAGDRSAASEDLKAYHAAGGGDFPAAVVSEPRPGGEEKGPVIEIGGPIQAFSRMAALSIHLAPDQILPSLAKNVVQAGYRMGTGSEGLQETEYLKLLFRYLSQVRELEILANEKHEIRIDACESPKTADLLRVLGYRMRGGCGSEVILETLNASRAFLTIDSGFPLAELEQALRTNRPFVHDFSPSHVPVLYGEEFWLSEKQKKQKTPFLDAFLSDPALCRAYLALSKMDPETAEVLRKQMGVEKLRAYAHVLDFFGEQFELRGGKAVIPGGERSAGAWKKLVGVAPVNGAEFYEKLVAKDDGWLASYYDSLIRIRGPVLDYLAAPERLERFYLALRGRVTSPGPARPVFRSNTDLMLLTTRLWIVGGGKPHLPGDLDVWKRLFTDSPDEVYDRKLRTIAPTWSDPDDVVEALFALCRKAADNEPLKIFMAASDIDRQRTTFLKPETVDRLARSYRKFGHQYQIFSETGALTDKTILSFLDTAEQIDRIRNRLLHADTLGSMQALVGLWQIFVRHGLIPEDKADTTLGSLLKGFGKLRNNRELYDVTSAGVATLMKATEAPSDVSAQDHFMDLLTGAANPADTESHRRLVEGMIRIFEAQRLVPLDTIFGVADNLEEVANGGELNTAILDRLTSRLAELQSRREGLSSIEKNALSFSYWPARHIELQRKLKIRARIRKANGAAEKIRNLRGQLAGILRDTLVGLNYIHYAPPGAQILITNPLFVRGHDFLDVQRDEQTWKRAEPRGVGWPASSGGRLVGSLSGLPYALAQAEQDFLVPTNEQALIWTDLVPQMILSAKVPRWWSVAPVQLQWVALHMRHAESAFAEAVLDKEKRTRLLAVLGRYAQPARVKRVGQLLRDGEAAAALARVTPSEMYFMAEVFRKENPSPDAVTREMDRLAAVHADLVSPEAISHAFGTPKPRLTHSYRPALLNLRTFPTLMGYSSRLLAESWESNLLYFAALADQVGLRPSQLNVMVPEWTKETVETVFASHLEDWPAVLRSLREVGERVRRLGPEQTGTKAPEAYLHSSAGREN